MDLITLEDIDEQAEYDVDEAAAVEVSPAGMWSNSPQPIQDVCPVPEGEADSASTGTPAATEKTAPCLTCDGRGIVPLGRAWQIDQDNLCPDCEGHGYPNIAPDDPLPKTQGPERVPYLHVRYHHGLQLWD